MNYKVCTICGRESFDMSRNTCGLRKGPGLYCEGEMVFPETESEKPNTSLKCDKCEREVHDPTFQDKTCGFRFAGGRHCDGTIKVVVDRV